MIEFVEFRKIPRLSRDIVVTEKIDGTNGCIYISEDLSPITLESGKVVPFLVGSRTRWIFPENDNHGFAAWAYCNAGELLKLGKGHHFGEWWGQKINRGYGLKEKRFSLFNVTKWADNPDRPTCCEVVPVLYQGPFLMDAINGTLEKLQLEGSFAAPGYHNPEGVVIFHKASGYLFKKTIFNDEQPKGQVDVS